MDSGRREQSPNQKPSDLGFDNIEPITPKKPKEVEPSLLDKVSSLFDLIKNKSKRAPFTRQEPYVNEPNQENRMRKLNTESDTSNNQYDDESRHAYRQFDTTSESSGRKYQRVVMVILGLIILVIIYQWLKPSDDPTVSDFHGIQLQTSDANNAQDLENVNSLDELSRLSSDQNIIDDNIIQPAIENTPIEQLIPDPVIENSSNIQNSPPPAPVKNTANNRSATETKKVVTETKKTASTTTAKSSANAKTLTVAPGKTLMQVFRDNQLNIADVNAMTKASGAQNVLSRFKPGDKIKVSTNASGRVTELQLSTGERFIRQSNGTYLYKK